MTAVIVSLLLLSCAVVTILLVAPRPRLDARPPAPRVPEGLSPAGLAGWLDDFESGQAQLIDGAEARIFWADGPAVTALCFLYIHGFSACRQETAPLAERIAAGFNANLVCARLAGHGLARGAMTASAEDWLQSVTDSWTIAAAVGKRVVVIATSTGAPLAVWLNQYLAKRGKLHSLVFLSPNFRIRNAFGFLLTWPWAESWLPLLIGREYAWEPENELTHRYWTSRYPVQAIIEMQKVVAWAAGNRPDSRRVPLATFYMQDDPSIDHRAAVRFHRAWDAPGKALHRVAGAGSPQHVFVGAITAPHRVDWCVAACTRFIRNVDAADGSRGAA